MAALNQNQFAQTPIQGQMDLEGFGSNVIAAQVDNAQATALVAGQAVKMATTAGGVPKVIGLAANTDQALGFIVYNLKDISYVANESVEMALFGSVMYMTAGGAITRGASVEVVQASSKVITTGGVNPVAGFALDKALADGDLIRVYIQAPFAQVNSNLNNATKTITVSATLAEINAGKTLIPGVAGQAITVVNYTARVTGAFATGTAIILESTNAAPVVVSTIAEAALTNGAIMVPSSANNTLGAGFGAAVGVADGIKVVNSGAAQTGGTSVAFTFTYLQQ